MICEVTSNNDQDQNASSAMIAIRYKDKYGTLWTIRAESPGFTLGKLKPQETSEFKEKQR